MPAYLLAFLIGAAAGLRTMTPVAAIAWAASHDSRLRRTKLAFLGSTAAPYIASALALGELVVDKLPQTPSRKALPSFAARIAAGTLCGAVLASRDASAPGGGIAGAAGAVAGTLGGFEFRRRLVRSTGGNDLPVALLEDAIAIGASAAASQAA
jgi:uncharacterized membrane protein